MGYSLYLIESWESEGDVIIQRRVSYNDAKRVANPPIPSDPPINKMPATSGNRMVSMSRNTIMIDPNQVTDQSVFNFIDEPSKLYDSRR